MDRARDVSLPKVVLILSALPFAAIGLAFLLVPTAMASLVGISLADTTSIADIRAVYGGLQLGCAAFLGYAATQHAWQRPALAFQIAAFGGLCFARIASYLASGLPSTVGYLLHAGEITGLAIGLFAWTRLDPIVTNAARRGATADTT